MMADPRLAVVFRTHFWDDFALRSATLLSEQSEGADFFVEINETECGPTDVSPFQKISNTTSAFESLGLPCIAPARDPPLWWNCDYGLYGAALALPGYDYYFVIEYDVAVNLRLRDVAERMAADAIDCITCFQPYEVTPAWGYAPSCVDLPYAKKLWTQMCIMLVTRRAAHHLLAERRRLARMYEGGQMSAWPICEAFVPSALADAGYSVLPLRSFADLTRFHSEYVYLETDPETRIPGSLCHAVLDAKRLWPKFMGRSLGVMLARGDTGQLRRTRNSLIQTGQVDHEGWRIVASDRNLALDRPARQSSLSRWSRKARAGDPDPGAADARGGNCGVLTGSYGFHTDGEDHPWWAVDLQGERRVQEVRIFNGRQAPERARRLIIEASADGTHWNEVFRKADDRVFAGNDDPLVCRLSQPVSAGHVRVVLDGSGPLHLGEVEVYGPEVTATEVVIDAAFPHSD